MSIVSTFLLRTKVEHALAVRDVGRETTARVIGGRGLRAAGGFVFWPSPICLRQARNGLMLLLGLVAGCSNEIDYNYKLTLRVEANGIVHTSSNIVRVKHWFEPAGTLTYASWAGGIKGEGNYIDLGRGQPLVALLTKTHNNSYGINRPVWSGSSPDGVLFNAYNINPGGKSEERRAALLELVTKRGPARIAFSSLPDLVTFSASLDPNTVRSVDPAHLDKVFGPGVILREATIEITEEPITRGLTKQLPWIDQRFAHLSGSRSGITDTGKLADLLLTSDFKQGI